MVAGCGFSGSSKQLLGRFCEALQASMAPRRSPMQDWTCFPLYLSMAVWNLLQHTQGQLQKIDGLADYLICELGLRNPSEMTMATVAALLSMHDPNGQAARSSAQQMYALLQTCRSRFKSVMARARAASREVVAYVQQLPSDTSRLPAQLVQARFAHGFSPAQVDLQELSRHARAWPLRETNNLVLGQGTQQAAATGSDALSLLQQAATVFRAMGLGPRSPRVPVEPWQRTDLSRRWRPLQVLPAHCLCSCQRKASSRSKALRSSCRHLCLSRRRRTPLKVKQRSACNRLSDLGTFRGTASCRVPARASGLGQPADAARPALLASQQQRRAADCNSCTARAAGQSPGGVRGRVGCRALWQKAAS